MVKKRLTFTCLTGNLHIVSVRNNNKLFLPISFPNSFAIIKLKTEKSGTISLVSSDILMCYVQRISTWKINFQGLCNLFIVVCIKFVLFYLFDHIQPQL